MSDVRGAILDRIWDAIAGPATASTFVTVLIVAAFFLGAQLLSEHRQVAAALRVAGLLTVLTGLMLAIHRPGWVTELDTATTSSVVAHRSTGFDVAALVITDLGKPVATAPYGPGWRVGWSPACWSSPPPASTSVCTGSPTSPRGRSWPRCS